MTTAIDGKGEISVDEVLDVLNEHAEDLREQLASTERAIDSLVRSGLVGSST
jgi:hypothetical protein